MSVESLLEVQSHDVEVRRLTHRRATLDQRQLLEAANAEQAAQQVAIDALGGARVEVATRQRRLEDEASIVSGRAERDEAKLYGGEVSGIKDLEALQHEIAGLREQQSRIEDQVLEAMEEAESLGTQMAALEDERSAVDQRITALVAEIAVAEQDIDAELERVTAARAEAAANVDPELLSNYEQLRGGFGTATAVRFDTNGCVGCPSMMPAMEIDRIKHLDGTDPINCQECGRIVVR